MDATSRPELIAARLRQLVLHWRCASCRRRSATPCTRSTASAVASTTSRTRTARGRSGWRSSTNGGRKIDALYQGKVGPLVTGLAQPVRDFGLARGGFPGRHRRHGDGHGRGHPRAHSRHARSLLRPGGERRRTTVGARVRHRARGRHSSAHHLGRALQLTNILRDLDEDAGVGRLYLPREALTEAGIEHQRSGDGACAARRSARSAAASSSGRATHFARGRHDHGALAAPGREGTAHHGRSLSHYS